VFLAAAVLVLTQSEVWVFTADDGYTLALRVAASVLTAIASAALAFRQTRPALAFAVNSAAVLSTIAVGYPSDFYQWTNLIAIYSLGAYGSGWQRWAGLPAGVAGVLSYFVRFPDEGNSAIAAFAASLWVVAWFAGRAYGARIERAQLRTERDLSRQLAEANEGRLALEEERNRIAGELHDIIGHSVNVMLVHAEAGRREIRRDVDTAAQAFDTISDTGRKALSELDRVLALLRQDDSDPALLHTPGIDDLNGLARTFIDTGLDVTISLTGEPDGVPDSVGLATYRIVQEALTNTLKHASATHAIVAVVVGDHEVQLQIGDDGTIGDSEIQPGRGILGMRERVALHQGSIHMSVSAEGGLGISATMRWEPAA